MAPRVSPGTTVCDAPATADPASAGAGTAGAAWAGAASAWPATAGAPAPKRRPEATAAAAAGLATEAALDLRENCRPCRATDVVGVARWRAGVDLRDMVMCLSHACGVSCRVRVGVTRSCPLL